MAGNKNSGRPRKPTAHLKVHGTFRKGRHAQRSEIEATGQPECPDGLSTHAQWLWDMVVRELSKQGVATEIDTANLWSMCEVWGLYRTSIEVAKIDPADKNARLAVVSYLAAFEAIASKFGLTPSDRAKLSVKKKEDVDEFDQFLSNHAKSITANLPRS